MESKGIFDWYKEVMNKYVTFSGRASRKEYWNFILANFLISCILLCIEFLFSGRSGYYYDMSYAYENSVLISIYNIAVFLPSLAVLVRRLHDTDKSAWWLLLLLCPIVGEIILLIFLFTKGDMHENNYGD